MAKAEQYGKILDRGESEKGYEDLDLSGDELAEIPDIHADAETEWERLFVRAESLRDAALARIDKEMIGAARSYLRRGGAEQVKRPISERQAETRAAAAPFMRGVRQPVPPRSAAGIKSEDVKLAEELYAQWSEEELKGIKPTAGRGPTDIGINFRTELQSLPREQAIRIMANFNALRRTKKLARDKRPASFEEMESAARQELKTDSYEGFVNKMKSRGTPVSSPEMLATYLAWQEAQADADHAQALYMTDPTNKALRDGAAEAQAAATGYGMFYVDKKTEAGRILKSLDYIKKAGVDPRLGWIGRFARAMETAGVPRKMVNEMVSAHEAGDIKEFRQLLKQALKPSLWQKFVWIRNAGLVTGPATQFVNITSNAAFRGLADFEKVFVAPAIEAVVAKVGGRRRERYMRELSPLLQGYRWAFSHDGIGALRHLGNQLGDIGAAFTDSFVSKKGPRAVRESKTRLISRQSKAEFAVAPVGERAEATFGAAYRLLGAFDDFFKALSAGPELHLRRYRAARRRGMGHDAALRQTSKDVAEMSSLFNVDRAMDPKLMEKYGHDLEAVKSKADRDTFQLALGELGQKGQELVRASPALSLLVPFVRTPTNILKEGLIRTPVGAMRFMTKRGRRMARDEQAEELAKVVTGMFIGSMFAVAAYEMLDEEGEVQISGGGPADPAKRANKVDTGWQPYSLRIGGRWYDYSRLEPMATVLGFAADLAETVHEHGGPGGIYEKATDEKQREEMIGELTNRLTHSIGENLLNKSFMMGISGFFEAVQPGKYARLKSWLSSMEASVVPAGIRAGARAYDPIYRKTNPWDGSAVLAGLPVVSMYLPPTRTAAGGKKRRFPEGAALSPIRVTDVKPDAAVQNEFDRLGYVPQRIGEYLTFRDSRYKLTQEEQDQLNALRRVSMKLVYTSLLRTPQYHALPDDSNDQPKYDMLRERMGKEPRTKKMAIQSAISKNEKQIRSRILDQASARAYLKRRRKRMRSP
jgi:hypothetical protein